MTHDTETDEALVDLATAGDRRALEALLRRQQAWIYNLAFYMLHHRQDAEDATQEVLVRVATGLSSFRRASAFRTWAHRIAVNHVLDRKRSRPESVVTGFECYADYLDRAPDQDFGEGVKDSPETALLIEEAKISCTMGMLLCLDRQQRLVFLLGELLETNDVVGAELLGTTRENFRQQLTRARAKLSGFMRGRCGLVDSQAPCRCARKTQAFVRDGIVDPKRLQFARGHGERPNQEVHRDGKSRAQALAEFQRATLEDLRGLYPWFEPPDVVERLRQALSSDVATALLDPNPSGGAS
jgi:RNA polymerase sigma factor (sigma-70 family)